LEAPPNRLLFLFWQHRRQLPRFIHRRRRTHERLTWLSSRCLFLYRFAGLATRKMVPRHAPDLKRIKSFGCWDHRLQMESHDKFLRRRPSKP
jgi:hypothetical protein